MKPVSWAVCVSVLTVIAPVASNADIVPFSTTISQEYLLISKSMSDGSTAISLTSDGNTLGHVPNLASSAVSLPSGVPTPLTTTPTYNGDAALLDSGGDSDYQGPKVYGDLDQGIVGRSNNFSNFSDAKFDNNDDQGLKNFKTNRGIEQFAVTTLSTSSAFKSEINNARSALLAMRGMDADVEIKTSSGDIKSDKVVILPKPGANIVKFTQTQGGDVKIDNANLVFQAPDGAAAGDRQAIVYVPDSANLLTSNGNILVGDKMGLMDVVFVSFRFDNSSHFSFSNTVLNGVAFWDMYREVEASSDPSEHVWNNVTGCTQLIGDKINLSSEIHLSNCGFRGVPEPNAFMMVTVVGVVGLIGSWVRKKYWA